MMGHATWLGEAEATECMPWKLAVRHRDESCAVIRSFGYHAAVMNLRTVDSPLKPVLHYENYQPAAIGSAMGLQTS